MGVRSMPLDGLSRGGALLAVVLLLPLSATAGDLHRWVDEDGNVHYSDAPPADATRSRHSRVREDGTTREEVDPAERREDPSAQESDAGAGSDTRRDQMLLDTYTSVEEIERTRERHLDSVRAEIQLAEHRLQRVRDRIDKYDRLLEELPEDSEYRPEMKRQRKAAKERLEQRRETLEKLQQKRERTKQKFTEDIARFRELKSDDGS